MKYVAYFLGDFKAEFVANSLLDLCDSNVSFFTDFCCLQPFYHIHSMTHEEYYNHTEEIEKFLQQQDDLQVQYLEKGLITRHKSLVFLGDELIQPLRLCSLTIQFVLFESAVKVNAEFEHQVQRMQLIAGYLQGLFVSTDLILEGNYIKASATLKQDYEIMARLNEIHKGKSKYGKVPNPQNGPLAMKKVYGYLNNIAHISKHDILASLLLFRDCQNVEGISPVKQIQEVFLKELIINDALIKLEILRHCLILHENLIGKDEIYNKGLIYWNVVIRLYGECKDIIELLSKQS